MHRLEKEGGALKRCFGMREAVTITAGTVIGVGLFTVGANAVGAQGPAVILATLAALAVSIYPALLYAEMGAAMPYAGGTYRYATAALGRPLGMLAGWNFVISMISVASGEALAFSFYLRTLLEALGVALPVSDALVACAVVVAFLALNVRGVEMSGRMQNGFMFFFWGVTAVWFLTMIPSMHLQNFSQGAMLFEGRFTQFLPCVALVWWCFAGFETCCAMGGEIKYPQINLPRALFLAPFIVFAVNALFQWVLIAVVPFQSLNALAEAATPYADGMKLAGVLGFPLVLLCAGIAFGGDFSTLNACLSAPARYLWTMARDGVLPAFLGRTHRRFQTPWTATALLGGLIVLLILTGSIPFIASLSLFATLFYYILGIASAWALRRRQPGLERPYRAPAIKVFAPLSIAIYALMMTQLDARAVILGAAWCVLGLVIYALCRQRGAAAPAWEAQPPLEAPSPQERRRMDREYKIWRGAVAAAVALVLALYAIAFFA